MKYLLAAMLIFVSFFTNAEESKFTIPGSDFLGTVIFFGFNTETTKQYQSLWYNKEKEKYFLIINTGEGKKDSDFITEVFSVYPFKKQMRNGTQEGYKIIMDNDFQMTIFVNKDKKGNPISSFITDGNIVLNISVNNLIFKGKAR